MRCGTQRRGWDRAGKTRASGDDVRSRRDCRWSCLCRMDQRWSVQVHFVEAAAAVASFTCWASEDRESSRRQRIQNEERGSMTSVVEVEEIEMFSPICESAWVHRTLDEVCSR